MSIGVQLVIEFNTNVKRFRKDLADAYRAVRRIKQRFR